MSRRNKPPKGKRRMRDWEGMLVISRRDLRNGAGFYPAGTVFRVEYAHRGLTLSSDACKHCGMKAYITNVDTDSVIEWMPGSALPIAVVYEFKKEEPYVEGND